MSGAVARQRLLHACTCIRACPPALLPPAGLYVYNKIDVCSMEEVDEIARRPHSIPISCYQKLNFDGLLARIWDMMVGLGAGAAAARCWVGGRRLVLEAAVHRLLGWWLAGWPFGWAHPLAGLCAYAHQEGPSSLAPTPPPRPPACRDLNAGPGARVHQEGGQQARLWRPRGAQVGLPLLLCGCS